MNANVFQVAGVRFFVREGAFESVRIYADSVKLLREEVMKNSTTMAAMQEHSNENISDLDYTSPSWVRAHPIRVNVHVGNRAGNGCFVGLAFLGRVLIRSKSTGHGYSSGRY